MPISDKEAVQYGLLVMYAEDMYVPGRTKPAYDERIDHAGWQPVAYLTAKDALLAKESITAKLRRWLGIPVKEKRVLAFGDTVFYGFLAQNKADKSRFAVAVRGTEGFAEWIIDADFAPYNNPREPGTKVERGFWGIYESMDLRGLDGITIIDKNAASGIAKTVGNGKVTNAGHSLGSALATYLSLETALLLKKKVTACLFASPRTGDAAWAALYDKTVGDYRLFNYILDVVPQVPFDAPPDIQYSTLRRETVIQPATAQADIRVGIGCNHHVICYCAMLDYAMTAKSPRNQADRSTWACVLGPQRESVNSKIAKDLAAKVQQLGRAAKLIVDALRVA